MADRYWVGDTDGDWNTAGNWASSSGGAGGAGVPTGSDVAKFDLAYTTQNCTLSAAGACLTLEIGQSGSNYDGTIDCNGFGLAVGTGGVDCTFGGSATFVEGSGNHTCAGDFDIRDIGTWTTASAGKWTLTGTTKTIYGANTKDVYHLEVTGSYTVGASANAFGFGNLTVSGSLAVNVEMRCQFVASGFVTLEAGGSITGSSIIKLQTSGTHTVTLNGDEFSPSDLRFLGSASVLITGSLSTLDCLVNWTPTGGSGQTFTWGSGSRTVTGDLVYNTATRSTNVDMATNNPSLTIQGDFTTNATNLTYSEGTGTITLSGTADQSLDVNGLGNIEDLVVDKTGGRVTMASDVTTDSFTFNDGDFDTNGFTLTSGGTVDVNGNLGARFWNGTDADQSSGVLDCGGNLTLDGQSGTQLVIDDLDIVINSPQTGTANYCDVTGSTKTGTAADIDATAATNNDNGSNVGWDFGGGGLPAGSTTFQQLHAIETGLYVTGLQPIGV